MQHQCNVQFNATYRGSSHLLPRPLDEKGIFGKRAWTREVGLARGIGVGTYRYVRGNSRAEETSCSGETVKDVGIRHDV
jgi:hypothetical protein